MANAKSDSNNKGTAGNVKKSEIIVEIDKRLTSRLDDIATDVRRMQYKLDGALSKLNQSRQDGSTSQHIEETCKSLREENAALRMEMRYLAAQNENIFLELSKRIAEVSVLLGGTPRTGVGATGALTAEIDYDKLAEKIVELLPAQEYLSADYIACKVAEQIIVPDGAPRAESPAPAESADSSAPAAVYAPVPVDLQLDEDELADRIALKVGSIKAEDFDILVDDEGCASISRELAGNLDYEEIASSVAEKLRSSIDFTAGADTDYEEMATRISEKITVAGINEDAIADKAASALSNYLPEIDTDEIADKVASQVLHGMPKADVDSETISKSISEKLIEVQEGHDYDIVIDDDGIAKLTEYVSGEVLKSTDSRFDEVDKNIAELKAMLEGMTFVRETIVAAEPVVEEEQFVAEDSTLVTVSDVVEEMPKEGDDEEEIIEELVNEIDEAPADGEIMPDGLDGAVPGGVDFEHMMKYNRSFIARIIQSTDEQKTYYGQVKTALLSYAKVNSNVAWGAERFNKGRETIARFKIRGKTLCLYLALDPAEYAMSVYHHADVSDNKSMHGTPMMVKIRSPRGVKKAIRLIDEMLEKRNGIKRNKVIERDYAAMYPYESIEELIEDGLVKDVNN